MTNVYAKFRKRPIVIEAVQYHPWDEEIPTIVCFCHKQQHRQAHIHTLEGLMLVTAEDWIIKGVNGEFYPCKPDIFLKTYEKYEDGPGNTKRI